MSNSLKSSSLGQHNNRSQVRLQWEGMEASVGLFVANGNGQSFFFLAEYFPFWRRRGMATAFFLVLIRVSLLSNRKFPQSGGSMTAVFLGASACLDNVSFMAVVYSDVFSLE